MESVEDLDSLLKKLLKKGELLEYLFGLGLLKRIELYGKSRKWRTRDKSPIGFADDAAKKYNISKRTIQRYLRVAKAITKDVFNLDTIDMYKSGELSKSSMIRKLKKYQKMKICKNCQYSIIKKCPYCTKKVVLCKKKKRKSLMESKNYCKSFTLKK